MSNQIQNFFKATISQDWSIGTGNFYLSVKPSTAPGRLVISPSSDTLREIVEYSTTGTDANGDYIVITTRGVGGTTEQTHTIGEKVRMNITAEDWEDMRDDIDSIQVAGAVNASTTERGIVEIATDAEVLAGTDTGGTGAKLVATPGQIKANYGKIVPIVRTYLTAASPATWTKPAGLKYVIVEVQAGGGNGGGSSAGKAGGGGGGGGYSRKLIAESSLGATETVTTGGATQSSSFGSHATATPGSNGGDSTGGEGGIGSSGNINIKGGGGGNGDIWNNNGLTGQSGGNGGNSVLGGGGPGLPQGQSGSTGGVYGGGGGGSASYKGGSSYSGGAGAPGIVIVTEFY